MVEKKTISYKKSESYCFINFNFRGTTQNPEFVRASFWFEFCDGYRAFDPGIYFFAILFKKWEEEEN